MPVETRVIDNDENEELLVVATYHTEIRRLVPRGSDTKKIAEGLSKELIEKIRAEVKE